MTQLEILDLAAADFSDRLDLVADDQWNAPSGLGEWTIRQLVAHVIGGNRMSTVILAGGSREEGLAQFRLQDDDADLRAAFADSAAEQAAAFAVPGALTAVVQHPAMPMPGAQLLEFRIGEYSLHAWDLARALGVDDTLDPSVVAAIWDFMSPMASFIGATGMFGDGPSGEVDEDAPLQVRVLDLSGRRP